MTQKVLVTGATGKTGALVFQRLREQSEQFEAIAFVRSEAKFIEHFGTIEGCYVGDITQPESLKPAMVGCDALVILTSAVPKMKVSPQPSSPPEFEFCPGGMPEAVDYHGQRHQIDGAIAAGIGHIVLVGSMGGTNERHPLNRLGNGNILIWKRKAEQYLIDSGVDYTIIRAGGLINQPGQRRELLVGKNDAFFDQTPNGIPTSIPRADVAEVVVQALLHPNARNKAFDIISKPEDDPSAKITTDFLALFAQTTAGL